MRHLNLAVFCLTFLLTSSECTNENEADPEPTFGHLKLTVTYPEMVIESDTMYWFQVPGVGAVARLYDEDARCKGYKDAMLDVVWIGDNFATSKYRLYSNENGEILFTDIPSGKYFLIVYARQLYKYTEKYIEVKGGDTLKLTKVFTPDLSFVKDLEPWDYVMPPLY